MIKFVTFLKRIYVLLLFIVLEVLCLRYYAGSTSYTKSRLLTFSNSVIGSLQRGISDVGHYFSLGAENRALMQQVAELNNRLAAYQQDTTAVDVTALGEFAQYHYMPARVIGNSVTRQENFFTLNKGLRDDVEANMAVISPQGSIVGYVVSCSDKFSACISVLNTQFHTSGKFKNADHVGGVHWDGRSAGEVMLTDIPRYAEIHKDDTIVTSHLSSIFPPGVMIGTVESWTLNDRTYCYDVKLNLATRVGSLREVVLVRYMDAAERATLENSAGY